MSQSTKEVPQPPKPPDLGREFELRTVQAIGVGLLAVIVVLAALGLFGINRGQAAARGESLDLEVSYPERFRYKMRGALDIRLTNTGSQPIETATVHFDRQYVDSFSGLQFTPSPESITDEYYEVVLMDIAPGMSKRIAVEVEAEEYWRHAGFVEVEANGESLRVDLSTFVFP